MVYVIQLASRIRTELQFRPDPALSKFIFPLSLLHPHRWPNKVPYINAITLVQPHD